MKYTLIAIVSLIVCVGTLKAQKITTLKTHKDTISYTIGMNIGKNFKAQSLEVDIPIFTQAFGDAMTGATMLLSDDEAQQIIMAMQEEIKSKHGAKMKELGEKNKKEGEAFLAENKKKEGVVTTASGLQYKIIKADTGAVPTADQTVTVHYRGTLIDGKEFESSYKRGKPTSYPVHGFIKGWIEALQMMHVGEKWQLFIPAELAYGERGSGADIGPNATLIFEIELLSIQ